MAKKEALRELQSRLAERLQAARTQTRGRSWLAVESAARGFLFPLKEAGEIFPLGSLIPVPHTNRWFLGVANLRGHLHGVVDLASFLGVKADQNTAVAPQGQLVGFNQALDLNCVLLVDKLSGLRSEEQLTPDGVDADSPRPSFVGARYRDASGRLWQELNLAALAGDEAFLRIVG
jgi:twitching motility protein PilI